MDSWQTPRPATGPSSAPQPMPMERPRRGRGLVNEVMESLAANIREGLIPVGAKLPSESEIMARFDVSRTVVREAISHLQASKLAETRHGVGTFALAPQSTDNFQIVDVDLATVSDVIQVLELRMCLCAAAARGASRPILRQVRSQRLTFSAFQ